jgi:hypothetical protein
MSLSVATILVTYNRVSHTKSVLDALRMHGRQK